MNDSTLGTPLKNSYKIPFKEIFCLDRNFEEDEEMLVLTHNDALSQTYTEGERLPSKSIKRQHNTENDDIKGNQSSTEETRLVFTHKDDKTQKQKSKISKYTFHASPQGQMFTETEDSEGLSSSEIIVSADSCLFKTSRGSNERKQLSEKQANNRETNLNQKKEKKICFSVMHRPPCGRHPEDIKKENEDVKMVSAFNLLTSLEQECATTSLATPVQSHRTNSKALNSCSTITAWEASWNVTNAIQV